MKNLFSVDAHIHAFHFVAGGVLHSADDGTCNTQSITTVRMGIACAEPDMLVQ